MKPLAAKSVITLAMLLALMIPVSMVSSLVDERKERQGEVYSEMSRSWGGDKTVFGGVFLSHGGEISMPEKTEIEGKISAETREKGIFSIPFYSAEITVRGHFSASSTGKKRTLNLSIYNNRAVDIRYVRINGRDVTSSLMPSGNIPNALIIGNYINVPGFVSSGKTDVTVSLTIKGIDRLMFHQLPGKLKIKLKSNWKDPNFTGSILPTSREISKEGFTSEWDLSENINDIEKAQRIFSDDETFGVSLFIPVNAYTQTDRSIKYAILFIGLTFLAFFLFEIFGHLRIHPFQYLLVGFALTIFYLLLLSLSEFISFTASYFAASAATILLIVLYSGKILKARSRTLSLGGMLSLLYLFLYILLQLEDYSLLLGSVALFIVLAAVMYMTRNVNWYELQER